MEKQLEDNPKFYRILNAAIEVFKLDLKNYFTIIDQVITEGIQKGVFKSILNICLTRKYFLAP